MSTRRDLFYSSMKIPKKSIFGMKIPKKEVMFAER